MKAGAVIGPHVAGLATPMGIVRLARFSAFHASHVLLGPCADLVMMVRMVCLRRQFKILKAVISSIPIDVMNNLNGIKCAPEIPFHYGPVLKLPSTTLNFYRYVILMIFLSAYRFLEIIGLPFFAVWCVKRMSSVKTAVTRKIPLASTSASTLAIVGFSGSRHRRELSI